MFGGGFWGAPIGLPGSDDHLTRERDPPPRPVELEFPEYVPTFHPQSLTLASSSQLRHKICHSKSYLDISDADITALNVNLQKDVPLASLVPKGRLESRPLPYDNDLQNMLDEVGVENENAFREVLRMPPLPGQKKPRLAYARNFFGSLEDMARYFDDSKDDYYRISMISGDRVDASKDSESSSKPTQDVDMLDTANKPISANELNTKEVYKGYRIASAESLSPGTRLAMLKNLLKTTMHKFQCRDHEPIPHPREKLVLRGVKIQSIQYHFCVARIPQDTKLARARHVEGPLMAVGSRDELRFKEKVGLQTPEKTPFVGERFDLFREIGCMLILAAQRARSSSEKSVNGQDKWWISKQRWGGGPTKWGQLASEVYEDEDPSWSPRERELQEQKRRQQEEDKAKGVDSKAVDLKKLEVDDLIAHNGGSDTTKASAFAGVKTNAMHGMPIIATDLDIRPKKKKMRSMDRPPGDEAVLRDGKRVMYVPPFKQRWYQDWQKLRPNASMIDDKIISKKLGATQEDEFDDVFMLTAANHHVALVRMRVHPVYLAWLENGTEVPNDDTEAENLKKNVLYVSRSSWYDVFKVEDRKEFLIGLWRTFSWINREYIPQEEYTQSEQAQPVS